MSLMVENTTLIQRVSGFNVYSMFLPNHFLMLIHPYFAVRESIYLGSIFIILTRCSTFLKCGFVAGSGAAVGAAAS